jgi:hypothetical protein
MAKMTHMNQKIASANVTSFPFPSISVARSHLPRKRNHALPLSWDVLRSLRGVVGGRK